MAVKATGITSRLHGPVISFATGPWAHTFRYKPKTIYGNIGFKAPFNVEAAVPVFRRWFAWRDGGGSVPTAQMLVGGTAQKVLVNPGAYTGNFTPYTYGFDGTDLFVFSNGVKNTQASAADAGGNSDIGLFGDIYGDGSDTDDEITRAAAWSTLVLSTCEMYYLDVGGSPGVIRPSASSALDTYLRLATDVLDYSPHAYTQISTGVVNTADPAGLLPETLTPLTTAGKITAAWHKDDGGAGTDFTLFMGDATDTTGSAWQFRACYYLPISGHVVHDPSIALSSNSARVYHIPHNGGADSYFDIALSTDQYTFSWICSPDCSSITGNGAGKRTFKPQEIVDPATGLVYIGVGLSSDALAAMKPYVLDQVTPGDYTTWTAPTLITITGQPAVCYDFFFFPKDGSWWLLFTDQATAKVCLAQSTSLKGTYTIVLNDVFGIVAEGVKIIVRPSDSRLIAYMDVFGTKEMFSVSVGTVMSAATVWSPPAYITINGITSEPGHFNAAGFSAVVAPVAFSGNISVFPLLGASCAVFYRAVKNVISGKISSRRDFFRSLFASNN